MKYFVLLMGNLAYLLFFWGTFPVMLLVSLPTLLLPRTVFLQITKGYVWLWLRALRYFCGITYEVTGAQNLPQNQPYIIASKHQSAWETYFFVWFLPDPAVILKKELMRLPIWGWFARKMRHIPVDRKAGTKALTQMITAAKQRLSEGRQLVIFPQGTRVKPGEHKKYHSGIAALYTKLDVAVVPVALNSGTVWQKRQRLKKPGHIQVEILAPLPPASKTGLDKKAFMQRLESAIEARQTQLDSA